MNNIQAKYRYTEVTSTPFDMTVFTIEKYIENRKDLKNFIMLCYKRRLLGVWKGFQKGKLAIIHLDVIIDKDDIEFYKDNTPSYYLPVYYECCNIINRAVTLIPKLRK